MGRVDFVKKKCEGKKKIDEKGVSFVFCSFLFKGEGGARVLVRAHMTASSHTFKSERLEGDRK